MTSSSETHKGEPHTVEDFLYKASEQDREAISSRLGEKAVDYITNVMHTDLLVPEHDMVEQQLDLVIKYGNRLIIISSDKNALQMNFLYEQDFVAAIEATDVVQRDALVDYAFLERGGADNSGVDFLLKVDGLVKAIDPKTEIHIHPSDPQRERVYTKAFSEIPNVIIS